MFDQTQPLGTRSMSATTIRAELLEHQKRCGDLRAELEKAQDKVRQLRVAFSEVCEHDYITVRDPWQYGEKHVYCWKCGKDMYSQYIHPVAIESELAD